MLVDAAQLTESSRLEADVVIAGGGVAGISLARQLADSGLSVLSWSPAVKNRRSARNRSTRAR